MKNLEEYNRYEYVIENIKDIIWEMDSNFIFTYVSSPVKEVLGFETDEVVGRCMFDLLSTESKKQVLDTWKSRLSKNDNLKYNLYETQFLCKDGNTVWFEVSVKPIVKDNSVVGYIGASRDISDKKYYEIELKKNIDELKNTNDKLRESEEKFRQLFENMINGFSLHEIIIDEDGEPVDYRYILVNKAYEQKMNQSLEQIIGKTIKEINPSLSEVMIKKYCKVGLIGEPISLEYYSKRLSKYFSVYCFSPIKGKFACIYEDVTERKMAEINLVKAKEIAENANETKNEFLSLISHEFKTPIAVINSAIQAMEVICKSELSEKANEYLKKIKQNSNRQLKLVNNLLDITRVNAGHFNTYKKNVDIVMLTKLITESITVFAEQKGIKLTFSSALKTKVIGLDEEKYERILLNLLSNAIKFTPKDKLITVKVYEKIIKKNVKYVSKLKILESAFPMINKK